MKVRSVTRLREFDALAPAWESLTRASGQTSPFVSHDWFACCWRTAGPDRRREVWMLEDAAGPVALVPLLHARERRGGLPVRAVRILSAPNTPWTDLPVMGSVDGIVSDFLASLRERRDWDVCTLERLPADGAILKTLQGALTGYLPWRVVGEERASYLTISDTWDEFLEKRPLDLRQGSLEVEARLDDTSTVTVEEHRELDPDGAVYAELTDLSRESWRGRPVMELASTDAASRFLRELTRRAGARGWLHVWLLRIGGRAVASEYQLGANGSLHALQTCRDTSAEPLRGDAELNLHILRSLFEHRRFHEYDFGLNSTHEKRQWANGSRSLVTIEMFAPTTYGRLVHRVATQLLPRAQRLRRRRRPGPG